MMSKNYERSSLSSQLRVTEVLERTCFFFFFFFFNTVFCLLVLLFDKIIPSVDPNQMSRTEASNLGLTVFFFLKAVTYGSNSR